MGAGPERVEQLSRHARFWAALGPEAYGRWLEVARHEVPEDVSAAWESPAPVVRTASVARPATPFRESMSDALERMYRLSV